MKKKVYIKDLSIDEILERLNDGQKLYVNCDNIYYQKLENFILRYEDNQCTDIGFTIELDNLRCPKYFIDEVEEPEADESCIGKLCWRWDIDDQAPVAMAVLKSIDPENSMKYIFESGEGWRHARPVSKEEALVLVKE